MEVRETGKSQWGRPWRYQDARLSGYIKPSQGLVTSLSLSLAASCAKAIRPGEVLHRYLARSEELKCGTGC